MPQYNEINDLYFTSMGDFVLGASGDLEDTSNYHYRGFLQKIDTHVRASTGDWRLQPDIGCNMISLLGERNTRETGALAQNLVTTRLVQHRVLLQQELLVDAIPVDTNQLALAVVVRPLGTPYQVNLIYTYDMRENKVVPRNL